LIEVTARARRRRTPAAVSLLLAVGLLVTACGGAAAPTTSSPASGKTGAATQAASVSGAPDAAKNEIVVEQGVDANTLDPGFINSTPESNILENMMQGLTTLNDKEQLVGVLATSWKNINPTTWQFDLRKGVTFQNGEPFDATAVQYRFNRDQDPAVKETRGTDTTIHFKEVQIVNPYEVNIITTQPEPLLPYLIADFFMVPPKDYSSHPLSYLATHPVGTGPFKFVSWVKGQAITETRWSGYWGTPAKVQTIVFKPEPEAATQMDALKTGAADITTVLTPDQIKQVNAFPNAKAVGFQSGRDIFVGFNMRKPWMKDVRVRQAMNYAINWSAIKTGLLDGYGNRMASIVVPGSTDIDPSIQPYPYDPAKAKQLLAAANFPMSQALTLDTPVGRYTDDEQIAQVVGSDLQAIGLNVTVKPIPWSVYAGSMLMQGKMNSLFLIGLGSAYTAQQNLQYVAPDFALQMTTWNDPTYNKAYNALTQTFGAANRQPLAYQAQQAVYDDPPWIFLWQQWEFYGVNKALNYTPRSDESIPLWNVSWNAQ
jgi:peptide/nickel transport system substrate-binding protein